MKISILWGKTAYGVDLSSDGAEIYEVSDADAQMIKSGRAIFVDGVLEYVKIENKKEGPTLVSVKIPMQYVVEPKEEDYSKPEQFAQISQIYNSIKTVIDGIKDNYSEIKRRPYGENREYREYYNINLKDIASEDGALSMEYYKVLQSIGCIFDDAIVDYFSSK